MLWFLRDYPLAAMFLRALTLTFQSLLIGGIVFCSRIVDSRVVNLEPSETFHTNARRLLSLSAVGIICSQFAFVALDSTMLLGTVPLHLMDLLTASYVLSGALSILVASIFLACLHRKFSLSSPLWLGFAIPFLLSSVWTSHAVSRLSDRTLLVLLTAIHQLTAAVWIGSLPFLWLWLRSQPAAAIRSITLRRYTKLAVGSVVGLILAGTWMAHLYTGSWSAIYGTAYGVVLSVKSILLLGVLAVGASSFLFIRKAPLQLSTTLLSVMRATEAEIGIGFILILVAASLTSQPPAVDMVQSRLTLPEIAVRLAPKWPRLHTPSIGSMPTVLPISQEIRDYDPSLQLAGSTNNATEQAWSEYNHHWAGMIVLCAGLLAGLARSQKFIWAKNWPLVFLGLAVFLFFRADPEAWPLGPRGFWQSFYNPEDLEHRLFVLLLLIFVAFEWRVQTGRNVSAKDALVFPLICALGGTLLLAHSHSLGNVKEELLATISHSILAIFAIFAGTSRWLELRLRNHGSRAAAWIWPICLIAIGLVLLDYREA